ncbi:MAG: hypothetical protein IKI56_04965 [Ruminococcus sp.]|nr:hypothetical protein [Ruminococcus sp.]
MKKIIAILLSIPAALIVLTGCGTDESSDSDNGVEITTAEESSGSEEVKDCCKEGEKDCCKEKEEAASKPDCCEEKEEDASKPDCCKDKEENVSIPDCCGG